MILNVLQTRQPFGIFKLLKTKKIIPDILFYNHGNDFVTQLSLILLKIC
jgi:hypothetical protein